MEEIIEQIRKKIENISKTWITRKKVDYDLVRNIVEEIKEILEVLISDGMQIDRQAGDIVIELLRNLMEGLQYEDDVLLVDTLKYGWLPYFDFVQKLEEEDSL